MTERRFKVGDVVQTRDGRKARIVSENMRGPYYSLLTIVEGENADHAIMHTAAGWYHTDGTPSHNDLVPAPRKRTAWVNFYGSTAAIFDTRGAADSQDSYDRRHLGERTARVRVEAEDGHFDD